MPQGVSPAASRPEAALLESVIQTAPDAILTINAGGVVLSFSPAAERMFGYAASAVVGRKVSMLMPEPHLGGHDGYLARYLATGERRIIGIGREVRARRRSGETFVAELAVGELRRGEEVIFTGFIRDATSRVDAERRAARLQRALDKVARIRELGELSTALAHEMNQPLAALSNYAQAARRMLTAEAPDPAAAAALLDRIAAEARRAGEILRRMRRFVDRGETELRPEAVVGMVREAAGLALSVAPPGRVSVRFDLEPDLPQVMADRVQIQQVVVNLVRNALDALNAQEDDGGAPHEPAGTIHLRAIRKDASTVTVSVCDDGPGLPDEPLEAAFEPFRSGRPSGAGVGLAVCRSIVEAHGGRIRAENVPAGGACVRFDLEAAA